MAIFNPLETKGYRKDLRKRETDAEALLWRHLRKRNCCGEKFYRQYGVGNYIADFYCHRLKLVIELDGGYHDHPSQKRYDQQRTEAMEAIGIKVIRFHNSEAEQHCPALLETLETAITDRRKALTLSPPEVLLRGRTKRRGKDEI